MKKIILILGVCFFACSDDEVKDPFVGRWQLNTTGLNAKFELAADADNVYKVFNAEFNDLQAETTTLFEPVKRERIQSVVIANAAEVKGVAFYNVRVSEDRKSMMSDSVYLGSRTGSQIIYTKFYNQTLVRQ